MGMKLILVAVLASALYVQGEDTGPQVAFTCDRPAMYHTDKGWTKDDSTDCLKDPVEILNYCRKVYPQLDIRNIVEASNYVTIDKWCGFGHSKCHRKYTVRPFRCLVGPFQSDALLVPEHCLFDHIHDSKECKRSEEWNTTATKSCLSRRMTMQSYAILQPCGVDRFNGVEFVCCPTEQDDVDQLLAEAVKTPEPVEPTDAPTPKPIVIDDESSEEEDSSEEYDDEEEEEYDEDEEYDDEYEDYEDEDYYSDEEEEEEQDAKAPAEENDAYTQYLHNTNGRYMNEHEYFLKAKSDLQKHHHEMVTKMMKEWAEARQRVQEMKVVDPKGAEKLNKEITARFQKTYEALEQEGLAEKKQLVALHQQRVQASLNDKKRHAMEHYMEVLTDSSPESAAILKALKHYVKTEQKDRLHTLNHYKHLLDTDPAEAETIRGQSLDHLKIIDQRITQAIDMLSRVPNLEKKIRLQIDEFSKTFHEIDVAINNLLIAVPEPKEPSDKEILDQYKDQQKEAPKTPSPTEEEPKPATEKHRIEISPVDVKNAPKYDDEVVENERDFVEVKPKHVAHAMSDGISHQQNYIEAKPMAKVTDAGQTVGIFVGCVTVFVVIVVGIVVLRKRAARVPPSHGFVEVDAAASPEERHVANMQISGYENPTYRYFEMNANA